MRSIPFERQKTLQVQYNGVDAGDYRVDFWVDSKVIVELKAIQRLTNIEVAQLMNYLKAAHSRVGLWFNFATPRLEYERRVV